MSRMEIQTDFQAIACAMTAIIDTNVQDVRLTAYCIPQSCGANNLLSFWPTVHTSS